MLNAGLDRSPFIHCQRWAACCVNSWLLMVHSGGETDYQCTAGQCWQQSATQERERGHFAVVGMLPHHPP